MPCGGVGGRHRFQSTLPRREATVAGEFAGSAGSIFQSTLPRREATHGLAHHVQIIVIPIHASPKGSDSQVLCLRAASEAISIHASPKGSDRHEHVGAEKLSWHFNPRFPEGKRLNARLTRGSAGPFQSTLPRREATSSVSYVPSPHTNFNPRFPEGKRPRVSHTGIVSVIFQSTLPRREATLGFLPRCLAVITFQSTLPRREATFTLFGMICVLSFQSTLPRREATPLGYGYGRMMVNFNPRFPEGKRRWTGCVG